MALRVVISIFLQKKSDELSVRFIEIVAGSVRHERLLTHIIPANPVLHQPRDGFTHLPLRRIDAWLRSYELI